MKKLLLPALLLAGASFASAQQTVLFTEDFNWIEPWTDSNEKAVDNFELNDWTIGTPRWDIAFIIDEENGNESGQYYLRNALWNKGYWCESIKKDGSVESNLGATSVYFGKNWMKFGKTGVQANFRFEVGEAAPADASCKLEFDWWAWRQGKIDAQGKIDPIALEVLLSNDGGATWETATAEPITHALPAGSDMKWIHAVVDLDGFEILPTTRIKITPTAEYWGVETANRWCLDNIVVYYEAAEEPVEGVVFFEDDFSWLAPWAEADGLGDPVGTDNPTAKVVQTMNSSLVNNETIYSHMTDKSLCPANNTLGGWPSPGYLYRMWPNSAWYTIYAADGYFQVGGEGQTGGLRTPSFRVTEEEADDLWLEFDWCPVKNANGEYAATSLYIEARPGNICIADGLTCELSTGDPYEWKHEKINLFDAGLTPAEACNVIIQSVEHGGNTNFYLDNIRVASALKGDSPETGVNGIVVEDNSNAPVEYYNLQGVRIANPENGLYIRRQGNKVSKVIL